MNTKWDTWEPQVGDVVIPVERSNPFGWNESMKELCEKAELCVIRKAERRSDGLTDSYRLDKAYHCVWSAICLIPVEQDVELENETIFSLI